MAYPIDWNQVYAISKGTYDGSGNTYLTNIDLYNFAFMPNRMSTGNYEIGRGGHNAGMGVNIPKSTRVSYRWHGIRADRVVYNNQLILIDNLPYYFGESDTFIPTPTTPNTRLCCTLGHFRNKVSTYVVGPWDRYSEYEGIPGWGSTAEQQMKFKRREAISWSKFNGVEGAAPDFRNRFIEAAGYSIMGGDSGLYQGMCDALFPCLVSVFDPKVCFHGAISLVGLVRRPELSTSVPELYTLSHYWDADGVYGIQSRGWAIDDYEYMARNESGNLNPSNETDIFINGRGAFKLRPDGGVDFHHYYWQQGDVGGVSERRVSTLYPGRRWEIPIRHYYTSGSWQSALTIYIDFVHPYFMIVFPFMLGNTPKATHCRTMSINV